MRSWLLLLLVLLFSNGFSQKISPADVTLSETLKKQFDEANIVLKKNETTFTFFLEKSSKTLKVEEVDQKDYIALTYGVNHVDRTYFNDQVRLGDYEIRNYKGRLISPDKFCGHYNQQGIFHSDAQVCAYKINIAQKGETRSASANKTYLDAKYLTTAYFHDEIPTMERSITFKIPLWVDVELLEINFQGFEIVKKVSENATYKEFTYTCTQLEPYPNYEHQPGSSHFMPHIVIRTKKYTVENKEVDVISSLQSLYNWYNSLTSKNKRMENELVPVLDQIISDSMSDQEKIRSIYYWVQDNVKYIAYENGLAGFKPEDSHHVLSKRYGDCKGMANLTKDLLTLAGFDARLAWLGTNHLAYTYEIPSLAVDNHMICAIKQHNGFLYLDATEKYNQLGYVAERIQGKQVLIEDGDSFIVNEIPDESIENYEHKTHLSFEILDGQLEANGVEQINGELKKNLINLFAAVPKEKHDLFYKSVAAGNANPDLVSLNANTVFERDSALIFDYSISLENQIQTFDEEVYIELDFKKDFYNQLIDTDRKAPYKLTNKSSKIVNAELSIPDKFNVKYLPDPLKIANSHFEFDLSYEVRGEKIIYNRKLNILDTYLGIEEFEEWNKAIGNLSKFYDDQIILAEK
ncbi:transglutaminase domain-containing protein [Fulvivirga sp. M361]|uniref:transglutaminase-like domain-containing protein n=1 Tax=Fulvivirga sp. M361 TaxID=2594266 RepID=UPI00117BD3AE|nr:transglutaminase-like domain-containing protein [Fulvivirga sp. M361]TRX58617.1 transglutaminase domain-containing protein [Fulvivirga sp. M361]